MEGRRIDGRQLRRLREQAGLRQTQLAKAVGCSAGHIRNMETVKPRAGDPKRGRHQPSPALVNLLLRELTTGLGRAVTVDEISAAESPEA